MYKFISCLNERFHFIYWIVNSSGELGVRVFGINCWYYKWPEPLIAKTGCDGGSWRTADKREFGEVIRSVKQ